MDLILRFACQVTNISYGPIKGEKISPSNSLNELCLIAYVWLKTVFFSRKKVFFFASPLMYLKGVLIQFSFDDETCKIERSVLGCDMHILSLHLLVALDCMLCRYVFTHNVFSRMQPALDQNPPCITPTNYEKITHSTLKQSPHLNLAQSQKQIV